MQLLSFFVAEKRKEREGESRQQDALDTILLFSPSIFKAIASIPYHTFVHIHMSKFCGCVFFALTALLLGAERALAFSIPRRQHQGTRNESWPLFASYARRNRYNEPSSPYRPLMPRPVDEQLGDSSSSYLLRRRHESTSPFRSDSWRQQGDILYDDDYYNNMHSSSVVVQGGSRVRYQTSPYKNRAHVNLETDGRPLDATVEMWQGPDNTPAKMRVYSDDGWTRPWKASFGKRGDSSSVFYDTQTAAILDIKNSGTMEFPMYASAGEAAECATMSTLPVPYLGPNNPTGFTEIQGGSVKTYSVGPEAAAVQVEITSDGLPVTAVVELLQGPNNVKQWAEIYVDDGYNHPWQAILDTTSRVYGDATGSQTSTIRIRNKGSITFPIQASVEEVPLHGHNYDRPRGGYR